MALSAVLLAAPKSSVLTMRAVGRARNASGVLLLQLHEAAVELLLDAQYGRSDGGGPAHGASVAAPRHTTVTATLG